MRIMLAEDNPGDVLLFREALRTSQLTCDLVIAGDGEKALHLLESSGQNEDPPLDLIVLDINLPRLSGQDVLQWIRAKPDLAGVPVMILTSSASPQDRNKAIGMGADLYVQKSSDLEDLLRIGTTIEGLMKKKQGSV